MSNFCIQTYQIGAASCCIVYYRLILVLGCVYDDYVVFFVGS
jgi:hypothetical protein